MVFHLGVLNFGYLGVVIRCLLVVLYPLFCYLLYVRLGVVSFRDLKDLVREFVSRPLLVVLERSVLRYVLEFVFGM